jgi:hypothetical protein
LEAGLAELTSLLPAAADGSDSDGVGARLAHLEAGLAFAASAREQPAGPHGATVGGARGGVGGPARSHPDDPLSVPGDACVQPAGSTLPASAHPQLSGQVCLFTRRQIRVSAHRPPPTAQLPAPTARRGPHAKFPPLGASATTRHAHATRALPRASARLAPCSGRCALHRPTRWRVGAARATVPPACALRH